MPADLPSVSVIVLNWNGRQHLSSCLESLLNLDYPSSQVQIILCDNGSRDHSVEFVREKFPTVDVVELDRNYGFAEGNNRAVAKAKGDWIAFLNNDMWVQPNWLRCMVEPLAHDSRIASVASKIVSWDGSAIDFIGGGVSLNGQGFQIDHGEEASLRDTPRRLLFACGGAMLVRKDLFLELGGFDPAFFAFFEDVDLGWRINLLGHDVWYAPEATVHHRHHSTADKIKTERIAVLYERNALSMIYKCLDDENLAAVLPAALMLLNERVLIHSHLNPRIFSIPGAADDRRAVERTTDSALPIDRNLVERGRRVLREKGFWTALGKGVRLPFRWLSVRTRPTARQMWPDHLLIPAVSIGWIIGASQFAHQLDSLREKRHWLQARRKRSDAELIPLFEDPFYISYPDPAFARFSRWLYHLFGLDRRFGAAARD
jgi:GT2 family glycosyltransferase